MAGRPRPPGSIPPVSSKGRFDRIEVGLKVITRGSHGLPLSQKEESELRAAWKTQPLQRDLRFIWTPPIINKPVLVRLVSHDKEARANQLTGSRITRNVRGAHELAHSSAQKVPDEIEFQVSGQCVAAMRQGRRPLALMQADRGFPVVESRQVWFRKNRGRINRPRPRGKGDPRRNHRQSNGGGDRIENLPRRSLCKHQQ